MGKLSTLGSETTFGLSDFLVKVKASAAGDVLVTLQNFINAIGGKTSNPYKFNAWRNGALTPGAAIIIFDTVVFDTSSNFSNSTGLFTAPVNGYYRFNATIAFNMTGANVAVGASLFKNGVLLAEGTTHVCMYGSTYQDANAVGGLFYLNAGDTVGVADPANCGKTLANTQAQSFFSGSMDSAT